MKKALPVILSVLCACTMAACRIQDPAPSSDPSTLQNTTAPTQPSTAAADTTGPTLPAVAPTAPTTLPTEAPDVWSHEAALTRFLTETNRTGKITYPPDIDPGDLPPAENIPQPDQSQIGSTVSVILAPEQQAIPFYYCSTETGQERLAVVIQERIPLLIVLETDLGGPAGLCEKIAANEAFEAEILSMANISYEEGMYTHQIEHKSFDCEIDIFSPPSQELCGEYIGMVGTISADNIVYRMAGAEASQSDDVFQRSVNVWYRIFARFELTEMLGNP